MVSPSELGAELNKNTENALMNALAVDPADRTKNANTFFVDLFSGKTVGRKVKKKSSGKPVVIAAVLAAILIVGFILFMVFGRDGAQIADDEVIGRVPGITAMDIEDAKNLCAAPESYAPADRSDDEQTENTEIIFEILTDAETIKTGDKELDGLIARQLPAEGEEITNGEYNGSKYTITVQLYEYDKDAEATKDKKIPVPSVKGKSYKDAKAELKSCGFNNVHKKQEYSETVAQGTVINQNVKTGDNVVADTKIVLTVSKGPKPVSTTEHRSENPAPQKPHSTPSENYEELPALS